MREIEEEHALELARAEKLMKGIVIPPRPMVLVAVLNEQAKAEVDLKRIVELISSDVALSAGTLRIVNSAFYGLRKKVSSIDRAVRLVGARNVANIVTGLMLNTAFNDRGRFMDSFWAASNRLATVAALASRHADGVSPDEAYAIGLFADSGVPLMLRRFEHYPDFYEKANLRDDRPVTAVEEEELGTDHTIIGYMIGRTWNLPDVFIQCILRHHDDEDYFSRPDVLGEVTPYLAVLHLALHVHRHVEGWPVRAEWDAIGASVCDYLDVGQTEIEVLLEEARALATEEEA